MNLLRALVDPRNIDLVAIGALLIGSAIAFWVAILYPGKGPADDLIDAIDRPKHQPTGNFSGSRSKRGTVAVFPDRRRELTGATLPQRKIGR